LDSVSDGSAETLRAAALRAVASFFFEAGIRRLTPSPAPGPRFTGAYNQPCAPFLTMVSSNCQNQSPKALPIGADCGRLKS